MRLHIHQAGSVVTIAILVAVIAILGFVGYKVYDQRRDGAGNASVSQQTDTDDSDSKNSTSQITTTNDLDEAAAALDGTDLDSSNAADESALDAQLAAF